MQETTPAKRLGMSSQTPIKFILNFSPQYNLYFLTMHIAQRF